MKFNIAAILVAYGLCATCACEAGWFASDKNLADEYDKIDEHLVKTTPNDDAVLNMAEVSRWLPETKGRLAKALGNIVALKSLASAMDCTKEDYKIVEANILGTRQSNIAYNPRRRVDKLVRKYVIDFNTFCYEHYPRIIDEKLGELDEMVVVNLRRIVEGYQYECSKEPQLYKVHKKDGFETCEEIDEEFKEKFNIRSVLLLASKEDPDHKYLWRVKSSETGEMVEHPEKVRAMFRRYIYEPCLQYNGEIGNDYMQLFQSDFAVRNQNGEVYYKCKNIAWNRIISKICNMVVNDEKFIKAALERTNFHNPVE